LEDIFNIRNVLRYGGWYYSPECLLFSRYAYYFGYFYSALRLTFSRSKKIGKLIHVETVLIYSKKALIGWTMIFFHCEKRDFT